MTIPLEDLCCDIIKKAQRGLGLSDNELTEKAGISKDQYHLLLNEKYDDQDIRLVAKALHLHPEALVASAHKRWAPGVAAINGLAVDHTKWGDMIVNAYMVWDPQSLNGAIFDTGVNAAGIIELLNKSAIKPKALYLTHTHGDHVAAVKEIQAAFQNIKIYVHLNEPFEGAEGIAGGFMDDIGSLQLRAIETSGHSPGGTTYFIEGLEQPVAIVGDSLFSGSMGKADTANYQQALINNKEKILKLPENTILCPGHGPLTTVGLEKKHNPCFAE